MEKPNIVLKTPEWFSIKNYDKCKSLNRREWAEQLDYRLALLEDIEGSFEDYLSTFYGYSREDILNNIYEFGIINLAPIPPKTPSPALSQREKELKRLESVAIRPISTQTMCIMGGHVKDVFQNNTSSPNKEKTDNFLKLYNQSNFDEFRRIHEQYDEEAPLETAFLSIDLSLPNSEILKQMKLFLPAYRKAFDIEAKTKLATPENISDLIECKTLAVLDLNIWEILNNIYIKPTVFIAALYPDNTKGEADLKRYKRNAEKLLNEHFIQLLRE